MAFLGAIAASQGEATHPIDVMLGAAINGGLTYGIASIVISQKAKLNALDKKTGNNQRVSNMAANYSDMNISDEMKDFLQTLEIVPGRYDGWYKDPSNLYKLRYFNKGKWTLVVSDSESAEDKSAALSKHLTPTTNAEALRHPEPLIDNIAAQTKPTNVFPAPTEINQKIEQLERVAELRRNGMISELEHENLKSEILKKY